MHSKFRFLRRTWLLLAIPLAASQFVANASAINIRLDYTYDTTNFFAPGSPARDSLEAAASFFSDILADTLEPIVVPEPIESSVSDGVMSWYWTMNFQHPTTGAQVEITNPPLSADEYVIFAGAMSHAGITAGIGAPGGMGWGNQITGTNSWSQSDINQINQTTDDFFDLVQTRGESSGFARWGGVVSFDTSSRTWHNNHTTLPSGGVTDLFSIAIHELAHALGFGQNDLDNQNITPWESHVSGASFYGTSSVSEYGGAVPLAADLSHWANGTQSTVYGSATAQEAAMDPDITQGTRKWFTNLDAAALADIGWTVVPLPGLDGDYNNDNKVDAADYVVWRRWNNQSITLPNDATPGTVSPADYAVWRSHFGQSSSGGGASAVPEPSSFAILPLALLTLGATRRTRRALIPRSQKS